MQSEGLENVPDHSGMIFATNPLSFIDSVVLTHSCRRKVTLLGKAECVTMPVARRLFPVADGRDGRCLPRWHPVS